MKPKTVLKSLAELSSEVVEMGSTKPAQARPKPSPAGVQQLQETGLPFRVPDYSDLAGYSHWGLNE